MKCHKNKIIGAAHQEYIQKKDFVITMKSKKIALAISLTTLFFFTSSGCSTNTTTTKTSASTDLKGQKAIKGPPPKNLIPAGATLSRSIGYDFNRDGVTDWAMVQQGKEIDTLIIKLSQANKQYKTMTLKQFDPDKDPQSHNFDWKVGVKLTDSGQLHISNGNTDPMSASSTNNNYHFKFIDNAFILQLYAHGYTGQAWGKYRIANIYDLANKRYISTDQERCDYRLDKFCKSADMVKLKEPLPRYTLEAFDVDKVSKALEGYRTTTKIKNPANAKYAIASYQDNGNGTVSDKINGLMWKKCSEGLTGLQCKTGNIKRYKWHDAVALKNVSFAGYKDWRLPTSDELYGMVKCSNGTAKKVAAKYTCGGVYRKAPTYQKPTLNQTVFPNTEANSYWTISKSDYSSDSKYKYYVGFSSGGLGVETPIFSYPIRLVRSINH